MAVIEELPPHGVVEEVQDGANQGRQSMFRLLQDHLWVVVDGSFEPKDPLAICYPEELSGLGKQDTGTATGDSQTKLALKATESSKKGLRVDEGYEQLLSRNFGRNNQLHGDKGETSGNKSQLIHLSQRMSPDNPFSHNARGGTSG